MYSKFNSCFFSSHETLFTGLFSPDSCRERRRECKRQSYRPSKARPAGHLYNSDGSQIADSNEQTLLNAIRDDINDKPYTLSQVCTFR